MSDEKWLPVPSSHGEYEVSSLGRLRKICRWTDGLHIYEHRLLPLEFARRGYYVVSLTIGGEQVRRPVHRYVIEAFHGAAVGDSTIPNHKNGVKTDNRAENLEWMTARENALHSYRVLGQRVMRGSEHGTSKIKETDAIAIRRARLKGATLQELAERYDLCQGTISMICLHKIWKHTLRKGEKALKPHTIHISTGDARPDTSRTPS